jgi:protocatechuate 3,4-dioxygenase beta subunit
VPQVLVELGTWRGTPYEFRDSLVRGVGARADDPRFRVVARTHTDATGRFRFGGVPKPQIFAMRAQPPRGLGYRVTYFESLFGLAHVDSVNFSITFEAE